MTNPLTVILTPEQKLFQFLTQDREWETLQTEGCSDGYLQDLILDEYRGGLTNGLYYLRAIPKLQFFDSPDPNKKALVYESYELLSKIREVLQIPEIKSEGENTFMANTTPAAPRSTAPPRLQKKTKGEPDLQPELIEDARQSKKLPAALKKLLAPCSEAIHNAGVWKQSENEYKEQIQELMAKHELASVELPNGGKLVFKAGKPSLTYVKPPKGSTPAESEGEGDEE